MPDKGTGIGRQPDKHEKLVEQELNRIIVGIKTMD